MSAVAAVTAAALSGVTAAESTAQPNLESPCTAVIGNLFSGLPDLANLFGSGSNVNINSGNNISIQTGPNDVTPAQSSSVGNNDGQNSNNVSTCCVNGRCCVSTDGGPETCTP